MYHPYFRGKQYELITIRESMGTLAAGNFVPIIEPVKQSLGPLQKALELSRDADQELIVIVNPFHGDHSGQGEGITTLLSDNFSDYEDLSIGILLHEDSCVTEIAELCQLHTDRSVSLIHAGFSNGRGLAEELGSRVGAMRHIFFEEKSGKLYRRHFTSDRRVLIRDGFKRRRNRDHPDEEFFSDLHLTYVDEGVNGFGDFLMVGDDYSETGGPAYAVAIHLTFIDEDRDDGMYIYHFKSQRMDTPTDPAGKFGEALTKLIFKLDSGQSKLLETSAISEFRQLHERGHFPGLGYVKKLSMKHHMETLQHFLS